MERVLISNDRFVMSKAGVKAEFDMAEKDKIFDSDWPYFGQLIAAGWEDDPAGSTGTSQNGKRSTYSNGPWVIDFPECPFIPCVILANYYSPTYELPTNFPRASGLQPMYWEYVQVGTASPYNTQARFTFEVTTSQIIITRRNEGGWRYGWPYALYYQVWGLPGPDAI